jgi:hypothetical protein
MLKMRIRTVIHSQRCKHFSHSSPFNVQDDCEQCFLLTYVVYFVHSPFGSGQILTNTLPDGAKELKDSISHALDTYFQSSNRANHELNLSSHDKFLLLYALQHSNHPTAFKVAVDYAYNFLRTNFPEFVKQAKQNANQPRQYFAIGLGQVLALVGVAWAVAMAVACNDRWIRAMACPFILLGAATWYGGLKGSCIFLHSFGHFQVKPWDAEGKDWRTLYKKRWYIRKVFDRELVVSEPVIRKGQNIEFFQGIWIGLGATVIVMAACLPVEEKRFFF